MRLLRRLVLTVLLLTVPFQAVLGATGLLCAAGAHHAQEAGPGSHNHGTPTAGEHHHHQLDGSGANLDSTAQADSHEAHGVTGKCKICSECCFTAAPIPASLPTVLPPDTPLRVSSIVEPDIVSCTGDGLFRPPRSTDV